MVLTTLAQWVVSGAAFAGPGDHIRAGSVEIVPDLDLGAEYRSNVFRREADGVGAANLLVSPGIKLTADGEDHGFRVDSSWELRKFFFVGEEQGTAAEVPSRLAGLDRFNEFDASAGIDLFKRSSLGLRLSNTTALQNWTADAPFADVPYSSQFRNGLRGGLRINPGSALEVVAGGGWAYDAYLAPRQGEIQNRTLNRRNTYGPSLETRWSFLPRTALVLRGTYDFYNWQLNEIESDSPLGNLEVPDSRQWKVWTGLDGQVTEKLLVQMFVGYGNGVYPDAATSGSVTGLRRLLLKSQVRYDLTPSTDERGGTKLSAGYMRDFRDSFFTNYLGLDQVFVGYDGRLGPFSPSARYEYRLERYEGSIARNDRVHRLRADMAYWFGDFASATLGGWWNQRGSTDALVEFDDFNVHLMATFRY